MSKSFTALVWKEARDMHWTALALPMLFAAMFYSVLTRVERGLSSFAPDREWYQWILAFVLVVGFLQTDRAARGDAKTLAMHVPVSPRQIFLAKFAVGAGLLLASMILGAAILAGWLAVVDHSNLTVQRANWLPAIAIGFGTLTYYAAGLNAGVSRKRAVAGVAGLFAAVISSIAVTVSESFALGMALSVLFTAMILIAASRAFARLEAEEGAAGFGEKFLQR